MVSQLWNAVSIYGPSLQAVVTKYNNPRDDVLGANHTGQRVRTVVRQAVGQEWIRSRRDMKQMIRSVVANREGRRMNGLLRDVVLIGNRIRLDSSSLI